MRAGSSRPDDSSFILHASSFILPVRVASVRRAAVSVLAGLVFAMLAWGEALHDSATWDEPFYVAAASTLGDGAPDPNVEHPPLAKLWMLAGQRALDAGGRSRVLSADELFGPLLRASRAAVVVLGAVLVALATAWAHAPGMLAGAAAAVLLATSPVLLAHGHLATLDAALALAFLTAATAGEAMTRRVTPVRFALVVLSVGAACATKWTGMLLIAALPAAAVLAAGDGVRTRARAAAWTLGACVLGATLLLPLYLATSGIGELERGLAKQLARWAVPKTGEFAMGTARERGAWWYYLACLALKTPLPVFPLAAAGAAAGGRRPFLWLPPLVLFVSMSAAPVQLGVRYVLPACTMLVLLAAQGVQRLSASRRGAVAAAVLVAGAAASSLAAYPRHVEYMHEARLLSAWNGYDWLGDSNGDWGQGAADLAADVDARSVGRLCIAWHQSRQFAPVWAGETALVEKRSNPPDCDTLAVSATLLFTDPRFASLRTMRPQNRGPVFLFDVRAMPRAEVPEW